MHLALASGRSCLNLDIYMMGENYVRQLVSEAVKDVDWLLVEGVMGLFDGVCPEHSRGSTADIARLLDAPILLISEAKGQARSFAAAVHGFVHFEPGLRFLGVIANQVGSVSHASVLAEALVSASLPPLIASIGKGQLPHLGSRHLGLIAPRNTGEMDVLATAVESAVSLEALSACTPLAAGAIADAPTSMDELTQYPLRLAVAEDDAFGFIYADLRERMRAHGVEWFAFSPLADRRLPEGVDALFLPGGYPEAYAEALSDNRPMLAALAQFAKERPVYAECGGLMLLGDSLFDEHGTCFNMAGVFPFSTVMQKRAARLGYCEVTFERATFFGESGERCRGHEFHYSSFVTEPDDSIERCYRVDYRKGDFKAEGFRRGKALASYVHLHLPSRPRLLSHFLKELSHETCSNSRVV
jgi:cobyrinic acid a,c-diamide synthase